MLCIHGAHDAGQYVGSGGITHICTLQVKWKRRRDLFNVVRENSGNSYLKIFHHRINSHRLSAVYVFVS